MPPCVPERVVKLRLPLPLRRSPTQTLRQLPPLLCPVSPHSDPRHFPGSVPPRCWSPCQYPCHFHSLRQFPPASAPSVTILIPLPHLFPRRSVPAYHGLARVILRSNVDATGSAAERSLRFAVNVDAGRGASSRIWIDGAASPPSSFTVSATAAGLAGASITIPLSMDASDSVLEAAQQSVHLADFGN
jgi:hypothetical protein